MSQIGKGMQGLKKAEVVEKPLDQRGGILAEIRIGTKLKKVTDDMKQKKPAEKSAPANAAELLAQFMDQRVCYQFISCFSILWFSAN